MNIKQQLEQVIAEMREANNALSPPSPLVRQRWVYELSAIVEQMGADEQAIVDEVNKRWPTGKPQPDDTFVGTATMKLSTPKRGEFVNDSGEQMPSASVQQNGTKPDALYSRGIMGDGSVILKDGLPMLPEEIVSALNATPQVPDGMMLVTNRLPEAYQQVLVLADGSDKYKDTSYSHEWNLGSVDARGEWSFKGIAASGYTVRGWIELPVIAAAKEEG